MGCPTVAAIEAMDDQEEAAFRVAVADFLLWRRQRARCWRDPARSHPLRRSTR